MIKYVQIQTTSRCSGKCLICPHRLSPFSKSPVDMNDELYKLVLDRLSVHKDTIEKISLYLANEPFADKKFIERLKLLYNEFPNVRVDISTNASLMTPEKSNQLFDVINQESKVIISHHGTNKKQIEHMMGIPYEKTISNIIHFLKNRPKILKARLVGLGNSIDNKLHYFDGSDYDDYWYGIAKENKFNFRNISIKYDRFHSRAGTVEFDEWNYDNTFKHPKVGGYRSCQICDRLMDWVHILATGDYVLCCKDYFYNTVMGNIKDMSIQELRSSDAFIEYKDKMSGKIMTDDSFICNNCMIPWG